MPTHGEIYKLLRKLDVEEGKEYVLDKLDRKVIVEGLGRSLDLEEEK